MSEVDVRALSALYSRAHDRMRDIDGLLPIEAMDELLKFLMYLDTMAHSQEPVGGELNCVRSRFRHGLPRIAPWALAIWPDSSINLSDRALTEVRSILAAVSHSEISTDVRSTALRTFLASDVRKSLGIFLTPDHVVRMMVELASPRPDDVVLDPACGSGTFLLETYRHLSRVAPSFQPTLFGVEKNPRMMLLAQLNLGHRSDVSFRSACGDSLRRLGRTDAPHGLVNESVDLILTNPPFGVTVSKGEAEALDLFGVPVNGKSEARLPSEVLFVELCLKLLRPGGKLAIVLPRSVVTNERLAGWRRSMDGIAHLTDLVDLPSETFAATGTYTTTVAAFFRRRLRLAKDTKNVPVRVTRLTNVGFDATGRTKEGNQLPTLVRHLSRDHGPADDAPDIRVFPSIPPDETLQRAASFLRVSRHGAGIELRSYLEFASTGKTPPRDRYSASGMFVIKVGNLTGRGIDWKPRDRNFVALEEARKRRRSATLGVRSGDLLLTSSAHAARYIAKKVDVVFDVPEEHQEAGVSFVGELIRLRVIPDVDPYVVLAALRTDTVQDDIRACVRGQTAHLYPEDLLDVRIPWSLRRPDTRLSEMARLLREEAELAFRLDGVSRSVNVGLAELVAEMRR